MLKHLFGESINAVARSGGWRLWDWPQGWETPTKMLPSTLETQNPARFSLMPGYKRWVTQCYASNTRLLFVAASVAFVGAPRHNRRGSKVAESGQVMESLPKVYIDRSVVLKTTTNTLIMMHLLLVWRDFKSLNSGLRQTWLGSRPDSVRLCPHWSV